jgi:hypothetical protein
MGSTCVTGLASKAESWMHRKIAKRKTGGRILELGAGTLNHIPYEKGFNVYDFVEPFTELWSDSAMLSATTAQYSDIRDVPPGNRYDRILSVAVLEHLTDLPDIVSRSALLLDSSGSFQAGIPAEGGLLWGLAWRCVTGPAYRLRTGLDYSALMRHEHVNTAREILAVIGYFFENVRTWSFPVPHLHLSFYICLEATGPRVDLCRRRLALPG